MATQSTRKKKAVTVKKRSDPLNGNLKTTVSGLWKMATIVGGLVVAVYGAVVAWTGLGLWVPAGVQLVDDHIEHAIKPIASKQDTQGISILSGRLEVLKGSKQVALDQKGRLELQTHTTKDPIALQIIQSQQRSVDDTIKEIDDQINNVTSELKQIQVQMKK